MGKNDVIETVRRYKEQVLSVMGPASVYLYGSYSKGTAHEGSDIDVAVVVPKVEGDFLKMSSLLWSLTWDINTLIEPVLLEESNRSPLYDDVIATGIAI